MCYIETSNLDGETNLKIRQVISYDNPSFCMMGHTAVGAMQRFPGLSGKREAMLSPWLVMASHDVTTGPSDDLGDEGHRQPGAALGAHGVREPQPPSLRVCRQPPIGRTQVRTRRAPMSDDPKLWLACLLAAAEALIGWSVVVLVYHHSLFVILSTSCRDFCREIQDSRQLY